MAKHMIEWLLWGTEGDPNFCADQDCPKPSTFNPGLHEKYHAKYCFADQKEPRHIVQANRTPEGLYAYNEFLIGLEKINQQEFVMPGKSGAKLREPLGFEGKNAVLNDLGPKGIEKLATWERQVRRRAETRNVMRYHENLLRRSRMDKQKAFETCSDGIPIRRETYMLLTREPEKDWTTLGMIVLVLTAANLLYAMIVQTLTLQQVCSAPFFCPNRGPAAKYPLSAPPSAYRMSGDASKELMAPTVASFAYPWDPYVADSGGKGYYIEWPYYQRHSGRINEQGYTKAWYNEAHLKELDALGVQLHLPEDVGQYCSVRKSTETPAENPYVWDPFVRTVREEYVKCDGKETRFTLKNQHGLPTNSSDYSESMTRVTFKKEVYDQRHIKTMQCMKDLQSKCKVKYGERDPKFCSKSCGEVLVGGKIENIQCELHTWWNQIKTSPNADYVFGEIETCVNNFFDTLPHVCDCHEKSWKHFPLRYFYQGKAANRLKVCDSGEDKNRLCRAEADCKQPTEKEKENQSVKQAVCLLKHPDARPISQNVDYGCFFASPTSNYELGFSFKKCNFEDADGTVEMSGGTLTRDQAQGLLDVQISKRTALVGIFLFKELGYISGIIVVFAVLVLLFFITLVMSPLISIVFLAFMNNKGDKGLGTRITIVRLCITIYDILYAQIEILFTMATNLSTTYRALSMISMVLRATVNKSLKDMDKKLTNLANLIYSLVLLVLIDESSGNASAGSAQGLGASIAGTLALLLFQLVTEKCALQALLTPLKDLNENRLSKFEAALLWCKILEDVLQEDIQYNWVQLFSSKQPLLPDFSHPQFQKEGIGDDETGQCDAGHFDTMVIDYVSNDPEVRMQYYMPPLDETLAKRFGHDGQGLQFNQRYKERSDIKQSVRVGNDGLLTFVEGYSEAAIIKGKAQGLPEANKYGHEDEPVITQTIELGDNIKTVEVELFYGSEHPHEYGRQQLGRDAHSLKRQASGITKANGASENGDLVKKEGGKTQRSAPPPQRSPGAIGRSPVEGGSGRPPSNPTSYQPPNPPNDFPEYGRQQLLPSPSQYVSRPFQYSSYRGDGRLPEYSHASFLLGNLRDAQTISSPTHSITIDMASLPGSQPNRLWSDRYI